MSPAAVEPPSTTSGPRRRRRLRGAAALALWAVLAPPALGAEQPSSNGPPSPGAGPPPLGAPAPDLTLFDGQGNESGLREILKEKVVVLVFYIGYT